MPVSATNSLRSKGKLETTSTSSPAARTSTTCATGCCWRAVGRDPAREREPWKPSHASSPPRCPRHMRRTKTRARLEGIIQGVHAKLSRVQPFHQGTVFSRKTRNQHQRTHQQQLSLPALNTDSLLKHMEKSWTNECEIQELVGL